MYIVVNAPFTPGIGGSNCLIDRVHEKAILLINQIQINLKVRKTCGLSGIFVTKKFVIPQRLLFRYCLLLIVFNLAELNTSDWINVTDCSRMADA